MHSSEGRTEILRPGTQLSVSTLDTGTVFRMLFDGVSRFRLLLVKESCLQVFLFQGSAHRCSGNWGVVGVKCSGNWGVVGVKCYLPLTSGYWESVVNVVIQFLLTRSFIY